MKEKWSLEISSNRALFSIDFKELWRYRDLLLMFVKRDVVTLYKQTILGPIWFFVQPILTTLVFVVVFGNIAEISTDGLPQPLFYLSGIIIWNYFLECFTQTSDTFSSNQELFGKVYFPRLIVPFSKVVSGLLKFFIQFLLFGAMLIYYQFFTDFEINLSINLLVIPLIVTLMAMFGIGFGLLFSSLTTKYRDLRFLIQFGVQLVMYASPIIYPLSILKGMNKPKLTWVIETNPLTYLIEGFRFVFLGKGEFGLNGMLYSIAVALIVLVVGILIFNKTERNFMDTV